MADPAEELKQAQAAGYSTVGEYRAAQAQQQPTRGQQELARGEAAANSIRSAGDRALAGVSRLTGAAPVDGGRQLYGGPLAPPGEGQAYYRDANGAYFVADRPPPAPMIRGERQRGGSSGSAFGGSRATGRVGAQKIGGGSTAAGNSVSIIGPDNSGPRPAWLGGPAEVNPEEIRSVNENAQFFASKKGIPTERDAAFADKFPNSFTAARLGGGVGVGSYQYAPGTLGSPTGIDYFGPMRADGTPASAGSGPWTVRARDDGTRTPLATDAFARRFGFQYAEDVREGLGKAAFVDVLKQKIPAGENSVNAYADRGGAAMEGALSRLMFARPGERVEFPDVPNASGKGGISNASTYIPLEGELFRPTVIEGKDRVDRSARSLALTYADKPEYALSEGVDPRYAAEVFAKAAEAGESGTFKTSKFQADYGALAKQYSDFAAQHDFIDRPDGKIFYAGPKGTPNVPQAPPPISEEKAKPKPPPPPPPPKKDEEEE